MEQELPERSDEGRNEEYEDLIVDRDRKGGHPSCTNGAPRRRQGDFTGLAASALALGLILGLLFNSSVLLGSTADGGGGGGEPSENVGGPATGAIGQEISPLEPLPPISDLLDGNHIIGDVGWMLDFVVVDYPKSGSTFLMNYLRKHVGNETYVYNGELCDMDKNRPDRIVKDFYHHHIGNRRTQDGRTVKFGFKCPKELESEYALTNYARYFPETKFIVSIRHPVLWFQSYYNFRAYHHFPVKMPPTKNLIGPCELGYPYIPWNCSTTCPSRNQHVCTNRANFHHTLSRLGKTPMSSREEKDLLMHDMEIVPMKNKVFIMESRQLIVENSASKHLSRDLQEFLGLEHKLRPLRPYVKRTSIYSNDRAVARMIDICEEEHKEVRDVLVRNGKDAAKWIKEFFIESPEVYVSLKKEFIALLDDWGMDPCEEKDNRRLWSDIHL